LSGTEVRRLFSADGGRVKQRGECVKYALDILFVLDLLKCRDAPYLLFWRRLRRFFVFGEAFGVSLHATEFKRKDRKDRKEDAKSKSAARVDAEGNGRWVTGGMGDRLRLHSSTMYRMVALFLDGVVLGGGSGVWPTQRD
jgi:hypothetical protein